MTHDTPLIATIVAGLGLAFIFGLLAQRFKLPPIAGYLLAGVVIGPFTPGYVANQQLATELAELGVILLMFGVGLHFSLKDLLAVRAIALPGAIGQILAATLIGMGLAYVLGWSAGAGLVFGLALSVASTVVLLKALQDRRLIETERGRIAVGWLIVEDLVMVLTLVLLPPLAGLLGGEAPASMKDTGLAAWLGVTTIWGKLGLTGVKVAAFVALMLIVGRKVIPWILHYVAHTGSRELFRLSVLAIALGVAFGSAELFGVSFALGAFFAGMVLAESQLSTQAARETLPLRDAFAVLFFVSVGMLFNPQVLLDQPLAVIGTFLTIVIGKSVAAYLIVRAFGYSKNVALTISASLAQIGEFSFILIVLGAQLAIVPGIARDLVVAGALLSIFVNPLLFMGLDRVTSSEDKPAKPAASPAPDEQPAAPAATAAPQAVAKTPAKTTAKPAPKPEPPEEKPTHLTNHAILVGHGRVGRRIAAVLCDKNVPFLVIEEEPSQVTDLLKTGIETFIGPAGEKPLLERINLPGAHWLLSAIPDPFEAGHLIEQARTVNPAIRIIARAHSQEAVDYLKGLGAHKIIVGEDEIANSMIADILTPAAPPALEVAAPEPAAPTTDEQQTSGGLSAA
ncbi:cation:proton antiporter [Methylocella sp. CPCC 101449]|uniref:cation:proton antiporter domain-containing protein n=1 Tax=Methylocella sp. CPCC 101449 TaxID=2987531 RepID=UPI00289079F8|nr:cation:proton antiporter [Methylocella sp. CPCC 101449]MDT2020871.1 cation:proton antiporter [Methylocella sp. CPCC 101449]HEV2570875.1 cation:proton antiporter [Beijerinckiaceae bacterium]